MRLPPTATVLINQTYHLPSLQTSTTNTKKSTFIPSHPLTVHSIPLPHWKTTSLIQQADFHLKIDSMKDDDSSKE